KTAQDDLKMKQDVKLMREKEYKEILNSGGYTQDQLANFKKNIDEQRTELNNSGSNYKRERKNHLNNIRTTFDRAKSVMGNQTDSD
ncbi:hypothetical protein QWX66_11515, partial [Neisseria gonorrhoeae]